MTKKETFYRPSIIYIDSIEDSLGRGTIEQLIENNRIFFPDGKPVKLDDLRGRFDIKLIPCDYNLNGFVGPCNYTVDLAKPLEKLN